MKLRPAWSRIAASLLLIAALPLPAQQPPRTEQLPELAAPPPASGERIDEPGVRIESGTREKIDEKVTNGRRVVHVSTEFGEEYYLIEDLGDGPGLRNESLDRGIRVPLWVIRRF